MGRMFDIPMNVTVWRVSGDRPRFTACAFIRKRRGYDKGKRPSERGACASDTAPKRALAKALTKVARTIKSRASAFRGYRRRG